MLFNHLRLGWEKIMTSQLKDVYVLLLSHDLDLEQIQLATGFEEMKARRALAHLESDLDLVETYIDSTGGGDRTIWRSKHTASGLRQLIARRLLLSLIDEFGPDLLTVIIEELLARPVAAQIVRDALGP